MKLRFTVASQTGRGSPHWMTWPTWLCSKSAKHPLITTSASFQVEQLLNCDQRTTAADLTGLPMATAEPAYLLRSVVDRAGRPPASRPVEPHLVL